MNVVTLPRRRLADSDIAELKRGDVVFDSRGVAYTVQADARPAKSATHYQAWGISSRGQVVARITYHEEWTR